MRPDARPTIIYAGPAGTRDPVRVIDGIQMEAWGDRAVFLHIYAPPLIDVTAMFPDALTCARSQIPGLALGRVLVTATCDRQQTCVVVDLPEGWSFVGAVPTGVVFAYGGGDVYQQVSP